MEMILPRRFIELKTVCRNVLAYIKSHTLSNKVSHNSDLLIIQLTKGKTSSMTLLPKFVINSALFDSICLNRKVTEASVMDGRNKSNPLTFCLLPPALFLERGINEQTNVGTYILLLICANRNTGVISRIPPSLTASILYLNLAVIPIAI